MKSKNDSIGVDRTYCKETPDGRMIVMNTTCGGVAKTLTNAHHYGGNIVHPREGFRQTGVLVIYERKKGGQV